MGPQREDVALREKRRNRVGHSDFFRPCVEPWKRYFGESKTLAQTKTHAERGMEIKKIPAALRARYENVPRMDGYSLVDTR